MHKGLMHWSIDKSLVKEDYPQTPLQLSIACDCFTREQTGLLQKDALYGALKRKNKRFCGFAFPG